MRKIFVILLLVFLAGNACQATPVAISTDTLGTKTIAPTSEPVFTQTVQSDTLLQPTPSITKGQGGVIAFYSDRDGNPEIYSIHPDGSLHR